MFRIAFLLITVALVAVVACAGRRLERASAAVLVLASIISPMVEIRQFAPPEVGIMAVDVAVLVFLTTIAVKSDRFWPLWAAGFQLVAVMIHVARLADKSIWFFAYGNAEVFWAYPVYFALIAGTWFEARRRNSSR